MLWRAFGTKSYTKSLPTPVLEHRKTVTTMNWIQKFDYKIHTTMEIVSTMNGMKKLKIFHNNNIITKRMNADDDWKDGDENEIPIPNGIEMNNSFIIFFSAKNFLMLLNIICMLLLLLVFFLILEFDIILLCVIIVCDDNDRLWVEINNLLFENGKVFFHHWNYWVIFFLFFSFMTKNVPFFFCLKFSLEDSVSLCFLFILPV